MVSGFFKEVSKFRNFKRFSFCVRRNFRDYVQYELLLENAAKSYSNSLLVY